MLPCILIIGLLFISYLYCVYFKCVLLLLLLLLLLLVSFFLLFFMIQMSVTLIESMFRCLSYLIQMFILYLQKKSNTSWCFFIVIVSIVIGRKYFNKKTCIKK